MDLQRTAGDGVLFAINAHAMKPEVVAILSWQAAKVGANAASVKVEAYCDVRGHATSIMSPRVKTI